MSRSTVHYADNTTNTILKKLHNKLRPAGTPIQRVEYIIELILLRMFETKLKREEGFKELREVFQKEEYKDLLFNYLKTIGSDLITEKLNKEFFPFYGDIINKVREVVKGNLDSKVADQLSLIQQVFKNSNFTNEVQSGNLAEVINAVDELDEDRLLQSDLLGDAIESALSETGGTKDMGLFRTPDHIRHFMVGLTEPSINDSIQDPACGTGGFLFDAYDYVMARMSAEYDNDEAEIKFRFPKFDKSHPEIKAWFEDFFHKNPTPIPSEEQSKLFYNQGVTGIEYLGIVKKMAAVNFYVRGINPNSIEQGDSLHLFRPERRESKSLVLANPPFGAEKDQTSYSNVWEDYSKESETTILFVKMMLDTLRVGGRCAVVVSEGFLTWGQNSARELRKMLLNDAILEAVIGLPPGVFVSKSGQGPKTSILLFKKANAGIEVTATQQVWFYQVQNDGYSKGSNRTVQANCQLVEALNFYHQYVKIGKTVPETKNSFTLSVDWLKTIDPRVKIKIKEEVRTTFEIQRDEAKQKLEEKLTLKFEKQLKKKLPSLFTEDLPQNLQENLKEELQKLESVWENRILNEIAKRIERAFIYSFNATTYRSTLTDLQIEQFKTILATKGYILTSDLRDSHNLDQWFIQLLSQKAKKNDDELIKNLLRFDPQNAIEADIVREIVSDYSTDNEAIKAIGELFKSGAKFSMVRLGEILTRRNETLTLRDDKLYQQITAKLWGKGIVPRGERVLGSEIKTKTQYVVREGNFVISKIDARSGACGLISKELDGAISSAEFPSFEVNNEEAHAKYIEFILSDTHFFAQLGAMVSGATGRRRLDIDDFLDLKIPLPPIEKQLELVAKVEKLQAVAKGAEMVVDNWDFEMPENDSWVSESVGNILELQRGFDLPKTDFLEGNIPVFGSNGIIGYHNEFTTKGQGVITGRSGTIGKVHFSENNFWSHNTSLFVKNFKGNFPRFIFYLLQKIDLKSLSEKTTAVPSLDRKNVYKIQVRIPKDVEEQKVVANLLDSQITQIDFLQSLKTQTEEKINQIISELWSEK